MIIHALLLSVVLIPEPPPGPLPWPVPTFPEVPDVEIADSFSEPTASTEYTDEKPAMLETIDGVVTPLSDIVEGVLAIFTNDDTPTTNDDTEITNPLTITGIGSADSVSMFEDIGTKVATVFGYVRLLVDLQYMFSPVGDESPIYFLLIWIGRALVWFATLNFFIFLIKLLISLIKMANPILNILITLIQNIPRVIAALR